MSLAFTSFCATQCQNGLWRRRERCSGITSSGRQCGRAAGGGVRGGGAVGTGLEGAWSELIDATPKGWFVGRPAYKPQYQTGWTLYAFDATEVVKKGKARKREWTSIGATEEQCVRGMTAAPMEISAGRMPR